MTLIVRHKDRRYKGGAAASKGRWKSRQVKAAIQILPIEPADENKLEPAADVGCPSDQLI